LESALSWRSINSGSSLSATRTVLAFSNVWYLCAAPELRPCLTTEISTFSLGLVNENVCSHGNFPPTDDSPLHPLRGNTVNTVLGRVAEASTVYIHVCLGIRPCLITGASPKPPLLTAGFSFFGLLLPFPLLLFNTHAFTTVIRPICNGLSRPIRIARSAAGSANTSCVFSRSLALNG
jgi:hypothetical protein